MAVMAGCSLPKLVVMTMIAASTVALNAWQQPNDDNVCYRYAQNPYVLFGTKTTYGAVAGSDLQNPSGVYLPIISMALAESPSAHTFKPSV